MTGTDIDLNFEHIELNRRALISLSLHGKDSPEIKELPQGDTEGCLEGLKGATLAVVCPWLGWGGRFDTGRTVASKADGVIQPLHRPSSFSL